MLVLGCSDSSSLCDPVVATDSERAIYMNLKSVSALAVASMVFLGGCAVTPKQLSDEENLAFARDKVTRVDAGQEQVTGAIDLYEAMARALKYNLDSQVEVMEAALRLRDLDLANYAQLPKLVASSGYAGRDKADRAPGAPSSSRDRDILDADLTFSWNVLDFGLSYVRAKQSADKYNIQVEAKRKIVNRVIEDVRTSYWRAASYERLVNRMRSLEGRVKGALRDTRALSSSGETSPLIALTYERELITVQREIETLEGELKLAKNQLAALMNLRPGTKFNLSVPKRRTSKLSLSSDPSELYTMAAANRPEMREVQYEMRINEKEVQVALLELLPSFNLYAGLNYDSNQVIADNEWVSYGAKVSWNLLKLVTLPAVKRQAEAKREMLDQRALSVAMAVMTQVHVSRVRFAHLQKSYGTASALSSVQHRILKQVRAETMADKTSQQLLIREEMNTLLADAKQDMVYADLQNAYANVYASLGINPFPAGLDLNQPVKVVASQLRELWLERGGAPKIVVASAE